MAGWTSPHVVKAASHTITDVVGGLKPQPALLALVVLNIVVIFAGAWFMSRIIEAQSTAIHELLVSCFPVIIHEGSLKEDRFKDYRGDTYDNREDRLPNPHPRF